ncbi:hypothetical protein C2E23DRAFT_884238 [Lenzites betulinus]|nr:hypothetical protein C2E23DRAFT_884238 [Lenzites betulinus]
MLAAFRQVAPPALHQCRSGVLSAARSVPHVRTLASSSVLKESLLSRPAWVRSLSKLDGKWSYLLGVAKEGVKKSKKDMKPEDIWKNKESNEVKELSPPNNAYSGRSVQVTNNEVAFALMKLKGILTVNAVRHTAVRDERHEKKGEKRNRLKSVRWRRRFAHEVRKKVQLVNEIRARGA